ncbi:MAG TPA: energy transducer TonB [Sphingomonas sp.]|nr:energy transducer TonB [Sphingomonas sp.]
MNIRLYLAAASALSLLAPAYAAQQQVKKPIVVTATPLTIDQWAARTTKSLEGHLHYPTYLLGREANEGMARIRFRCSEDGTPSAVTLAGTSGHHELDSEALRAVSSIRTLHPLPDGITHDQQFQAVVLFAKDRQSYDRQVASIHDEAMRHNALAARGGAPMAVSIGLVAAN